MTPRRFQLLVCVALLLIGGEMLGQAIAPPIAEFRSAAKVDGMFEVRNDMDYPMATILETKSFGVDDHGNVLYRPLDPGVQIKLGASSFVLAPHDSRYIFYKATLPAAPASFSIVTTMTKAGKTSGMRINFIFPHMVYVYQKEKLRRSDVLVRVTAGQLQVQNTSEKLGRVDGVDTKEQDFGGFPLYPQQTRIVPVSDGKVTVRFQDGFKVELP